MGNVTNFAAASAGGAVTNTGAAGGIGDIGVNADAAAAAWGGMSGNVYGPTAVNCRAAFSVAVGGVPVPVSRCVIESMGYGASEAQVAAVVSASAGQAVDMRVKVDCGTVAVFQSEFSIDRKL